MSPLQFSGKAAVISQGQSGWKCGYFTREGIALRVESKCGSFNYLFHSVFLVELFLFIIIYLIEKDVYPFNLMMSDREESMDRMLLKPFSPVVVATYTDSSRWKMACESEKAWEIIGGKCRIHF